MSICFKGSVGRRRATALGALLALASSSGCAAEGALGEEDALGSVGQGLGTAHLLGGIGASETSVSKVGDDGTVIMTANKEDIPPWETFPNGVRRITPGVTLMGYTRYELFTKTVVSSDNIVFDPPGWSALWGDPAVARNAWNGLSMYITNLAIPNSKFPSSGEILGSVAPSGLPANMCNSYIGGACVARSTDSGVSFSASASDCFQRITAQCPFGTFYDGSDVESASSGRVYVAFNDVTRSRADVYQANSPGGAFSRLTDPAPTTSLHPRLRSGPGGIYLLVQSGNNLVLTRYPATSSFTAAWTTPVTVATGITRDDVVLSDRFLRLGPQYDLAIGPDENGVQVVRVVYTVLSASKHKVRVSQCTTGATITCTHPGAWETDSAPGQQWNPAIITGDKTLGGRHWSVSFYSNRNNPTGNLVELWGGTVELTSGGSTMTTFRLETSQVPCPDLRGYWGDYDDMQVGFFGYVYRGFTDSSHGACTRSQYLGTPMVAAISTWQR